MTQLTTRRISDTQYEVTTQSGRVLGGIVKWHKSDAVNHTGVPQYRHPWGDSATLAEAVREFEAIGQ